MTTLENPRELRGLAIISKGGDAIARVSDAAYSVKSQSNEGRYAVALGRTGNWYCECPDFTGRNVNCKHIFAVLFSRKLRLEAEREAPAVAPVEPAGTRPAICPACDSPQVARFGRRATKNGAVQRFRCDSCAHRFTVDRGFSRVKTDPKAITVAMDLYFKGVSIRKIQDHLKQFHNLKVSTATPLRWIWKYLALLSTYADRHRAEVGQFWHSDEMMVNVREPGREGNLLWLWNLMDHDTRFMLACRISKTRYAGDARRPLQDAKDRSLVRPKALITDGLQAYVSAVQREFYDSMATPKNPHLRIPPMRGDPERVHPSNNIIERLNGSVRERVKVMRGMDSEDTAQETMEGWRTYYNLLRPHMGLDGGIPATAAGIPVPVDGNRWLALIERATTQVRA